MMQKFIIRQINATMAAAIITGQDAKHIFKVLRLNRGDSINITNGQGKDYVAKIVSISKTEITVNKIKECKSVTESPINITLCSGMLKDKKMDMVIKHITQLGITEWIPFFCKRSIPTPDAKRMEKRIQRWESIAKESLKQCGRSSLPKISTPVDFTKLMNHSVNYNNKIAFWEKASIRLDTLKQGSARPEVIVLIGPEGGFSEEEISLAEENGFLSYSLGPRILRAETASISSCTLIQHILGDL